MSGNTLAHNAGQNVPASESENENVIDFSYDHKNFPFWQAHADNAAAYARTLQEMADKAQLDGESELENSILALAKEFTCVARDFKEYGNRVLAQNVGPQPPTPTPTPTPTYIVTPRGQRLLNLLTYDRVHFTAADLDALLGELEVAFTIQELRACEKGNFKFIRPITIQRGLIVCTSAPENTGGAA